MTVDLPSFSLPCTQLRGWNGDFDASTSNCAAQPSFDTAPWRSSDILNRRLSQNCKMIFVRRQHNFVANLVVLSCNMLFQTLLLFLFMTSLSSQIPFAKRAFSNGPVITDNFPDPAFIHVGDTYYAFATTNGAQNIPVATSPDFNTWTVTGQDALPTIPSWSNGATWAPDVLQLVSFSTLRFLCLHDTDPIRPTAPS